MSAPGVTVLRIAHSTNVERVALDGPYTVYRVR